MITTLFDKSMRMIFILLGVLVFLFYGHNSFAETSSQPATSAKPVSEKTSAPGGTVSGGSGTVTPDLFTGTMSYSIPIEVSPGRKGMQPSLALTYRSSNGNGWVGVGWDLDVGAIERSARSGINYSGNEYILRMNGSAIDLMQVGDDFQARIEGSFFRVKKVGNYFEVTDKAGVKYLYGQDTGSRQDNPVDATKIFKWCLDRVEDTNGNYMTFSYFKDQGQIYLDRIDYTGNATATPNQPTTNYVKFYRESRNDAPDMYSTNFKIKTAYRLKTIEVIANCVGSCNPDEKRVRAYTLGYDVDQNTVGSQYSISTGRSLLTKVQQYDKNAAVDTNNGTVTGGISLPAVTFIWKQDASSGSFGPRTLQSNAGDGANFTGFSRQMADVDGDGKPDVVIFDTGNEYIYTRFNNGNGTFGPRTERSGNGDNYSGIIRTTADVDGDGKADAVLIDPGQEYVYTRLGNGDGSFGPRTLQSNAGDGANFTGFSRQMADVDGDGKPDVIIFDTGNEYVYTRHNNGDGTFGPRTTRSGDGANYSGIMRTTADVDGDGKADVVLIDPGQEYVYTRLGNGDGSFGPRTLLSNAGDGANFSGITREMSDVNGDGKADVVLLDPGNEYVYVRLSRGDGTFGPRIPSGDGANFTGFARQLADVNGDGRPDVVIFDTGNEYIYMRFNNGDGTFGPRTERSGNGDNYSGIIRATADVDGDGKADAVLIDPGQEYVYTRISGTINGTPDVLSSISNGIGGTTTIEYKPSTQYPTPQPQLPFPIQTVYKVTTNDGNNVESTTTYDYQGGFFYIGIEEKDFRGFNHVTVTGPGSINERRITETWFHQGNDISLENNPNVATGYMKGKPYRTRVKDGAGNIYAETTTEYWADADNPPAAPYFNPPKEMHNYSNGGEGVSGMHTKTVYTTYDHTNGNLLQVDQHGDVTVTTDDKTIVKTYGPNTTAWILGLPTSETIRIGIGTTGAVASQTTYYYDGTTDCNTASQNQTPTKGNLTRIVRWLDGGASPEVRMAYDDYGNLKCTQDAKGNPPSTISYDGTFTFPKVKTNPLGHQVTTKYYGVDGEDTTTGLYGQVKSITDPNNTVVSMEYDTFGRKKKTTAPDGTWTESFYNNFGTINSTIDSQHVLVKTAVGIWTWTYFDGFGRTIRERKHGPNGQFIVTKTEYNNTGTVYRTSLPDFEGTTRWTTFEYDAVGRMTRTAHHDGTDARACYNDGVTVTLMPDSSSTGTHWYNRKREEKDAFGRLVRVNEYQGRYNTCTTGESDQGNPYATTTYEYDVMGNLRYVRDAENNTTEMYYDTLGRKDWMTDPDMGHWSYTYDKNGNLETQTDAKGQLITFTYDELNRIKKKDYADPAAVDVVYTYDVAPDGPYTTYPIGRLSKMTDETGETRYYYDLAGRAKTTVKKVDGVDYPVTVDYTLGRMTAITYPDSSVVGYEYDGGGNIWKVKENVAGTNYAVYNNYNALGQHGSITYGNGVTTTYNYRTDNNRLQDIITKNAAQNTLFSQTYGYYDGGAVHTIMDNLDSNQTQTFDYDGLNRLMNAQSTAYGTLSYQYTKIGNIWWKEGVEYTYSKVNAGPHAVTSTSDGKTYLYDANGNMTADGTRTLTYNYDNMPDTVTLGTETSSYKYDGSGARTKKITSTGAVIYIGKLYECKDGICSKYVFAGSTRIALKSASDTLYYHSDHLGSSSIVTNQLQAVAETVRYYPFGAAREDTGEVSVNHKYTGQEYDAESGLYFYNARYYHPVLGRFISPDTLVPDPTNPQSLNRYSYVLNNPLMYIDPTGHHHRHFHWRKVIANAIIVVTAVVTFECGGCGTAMMSGLYGALIGEVSGAYSAYRTGGDYLSGVVVGGATGFISGYLGSNAGDLVKNLIPGKNLIEYIANGVVRGSIQGAGTGAAIGYAGGMGDIWDGMIQGMKLGAIGGLVIGAAEWAVQQQGWLSDAKMDWETAKTKLAEGMSKVGNSSDLGAVLESGLKAVGKAFLEPVGREILKNDLSAFTALSVGVAAEETNETVSKLINEKIEKTKTKEQTIKFKW